MGVASIAEALIFKSKSIVFFSVLALLAFIKAGVWFVPSLGKIATNPAPEQTTFSASVISVGGGDTIYEFFFTYLMFALAFYSVIGLLVRKLPSHHRRIAAVLFVVFPVSYTGLYWVGPDSFLLFLVSLIVLFRSRPLYVLLVSVFVGLEHFEVGVFLGIGLVLASITQRHPDDRQHPILSSWLVIAGVLAGKVSHLLIFSATTVGSSKVDWWLTNWADVLSQVALRPHLILWGTLAVGWVVFLRALGDNSLAIQVIAGLSPAFLLLLIVEDQTRIFALVSAPVVLIYLVFNQQFISHISQRFTAVLALAWIAIPTIWVWGGYPRWGVLPYDLGVVLNYFFPVLDLPVSAHWPFI